MRFRLAKKILTGRRIPLIRGISVTHLSLRKDPPRWRTSKITKKQLSRFAMGNAKYKLGRRISDRVHAMTCRPPRRSNLSMPSRATAIERGTVEISSVDAARRGSYKTRIPTITIERGDITTVKVDAIVNAANPIMLGGGGVDGAIHAAAGPELLEACRRFAVVDGIRCPFGEALITPGFALPALHVIHAVGPIFRSDPNPEETLRSAYAVSLGLARDYDLKSIAFPAISTGAYGFPLESAARIALSTANADWGSVERVCFVLFDTPVMEAFVKVAAELSLTV